MFDTYEVPDLDILSNEELLLILKDAKAGDPIAKEEVVKRNMKLVVWVAKHYRNMGVPMEDLVQEGNIGLLRALEKYNPDLGTFIDILLTDKSGGFLDSKRR